MLLKEEFWHFPFSHLLFALWKRIKDFKVMFCSLTHEPHLLSHWCFLVEKRTPVFCIQFYCLILQYPSATDCQSHLPTAESVFRRQLFAKLYMLWGWIVSLYFALSKEWYASALPQKQKKERHVTLSHNSIPVQSPSLPPLFQRKGHLLLISASTTGLSQWSSSSTLLQQQ